MASGFFLFVSNTGDQRHQQALFPAFLYRSFGAVEFVVDIPQFLPEPHVPREAQQQNHRRSAGQRKVAYRHTKMAVDKTREWFTIVTFLLRPTQFSVVPGLAAVSVEYVIGGEGGEGAEEQPLHRGSGIGLSHHSVTSPIKSL